MPTDGLTAARFYNKTSYSGLETHIANSYINPLLQVLKFTPLVRNLALHHTASTCTHETCLLCEMGFLFDTLEKAEGQNCQATNFLKTFSNLPQGETAFPCSRMSRAKGEISGPVGPS